MTDHEGNEYKEYDGYMWKFTPEPNERLYKTPLPLGVDPVWEEISLTPSQ